MKMENSGNKMKLSIKKCCLTYFSFTKQHTLVFIQRLSIPLIKSGQRYYFDLNQSHPLAYSIKLKLQKDELKVFYTITDLSNKYCKDPKTIRKLLLKNNIPLYGNNKKYVYLWDLYIFQKNIGNIHQYLGNNNEEII